MNKTGEIEIGEQIISFEKAETIQVKWLCQKKQSRRQLTLHRNLYKLGE